MADQGLAWEERGQGPWLAEAGRQRESQSSGKADPAYRPALGTRRDLFRLPLSPHSTDGETEIREGIRLPRHIMSVNDDPRSVP